MDERNHNGNNHVRDHSRAFSSIGPRNKGERKRTRTPVPQKPPKVETPVNKYNRKKIKKETMNIIKGMLLAVLLSASALFAQSNVITNVSWEASINPDVDKMIILVWTGLDPLECPLLQDSLVSTIDPTAYNNLTLVDTTDALSLSYLFQTIQNGELMRVAGVFMNTSDVQSPMAVSVFTYIPGRPLRPTFIELEFTIE